MGLAQRLRQILQQKLGGDGSPRDPALRDDILLTTIPVGPGETAARELSPQRATLVMGF